MCTFPTPRATTSYPLPREVSAGQFKDNDGEAGSFNSAPTKTGKRKFVGSAVKTDDAPAEKGDLPDSTQNEGEPEVKKVKKEVKAVHRRLVSG